MQLKKSWDFQIFIGERIFEIGEIFDAFATTPKFEKKKYKKNHSTARWTPDWTHDCHHVDWHHVEHAVSALE